MVFFRAHASRLLAAALAVFCLGLCASAPAQDGGEAEVAPPTNTMYTREVADVVYGGLQFLARQQQRSGAIGKTAQVATTSLAGMAFLAGGNTLGRGAHAEQLKQCVDYILSNQMLNGYFTANGDEASRMHGHGFAITFLSEVYGMSKPGPSERVNKLESIKQALDKAVKLAVESQSPEGGWNYEPGAGNRQHEGSITVCIVEGLRAARNAGIVVPKETIDKAVDYMKKSWDGKASFQYKLGQEGPPSFALAAAGACVLIAAGDASRDTARMIEDATDFVRSMPAGLGKDSAHRFWFYGYFYATQAMHFRGGDDWQEWYPDIRDALMKKREEGGGMVSWTSPSNEAGGDKAFATTMALLILQMPNEYLPIFQR